MPGSEASLTRQRLALYSSDRQSKFWPRYGVALAENQPSLLTWGLIWQNIHTDKHIQRLINVTSLMVHCTSWEKVPKGFATRLNSVVGHSRNHQLFTRLVWHQNNVAIISQHAAEHRCCKKGKPQKSIIRAWMWGARGKCNYLVGLAWHEGRQAKAEKGSQNTYAGYLCCIQYDQVDYLLTPFSKWWFW